jgi:SAM-dependent methyltransferase
LWLGVPQKGNLQGRRLEGGGMKQSQLYSLYDSDPRPVADFIDYLRGLYGLPTPGRLLDMGCGPGRLLVPLSESGWNLTGYEPDPDYVVAAKEAAENLPDVQIYQRGFLDLEEDSEYDLIAAVNGPYYYLLLASDRRDALTRCRWALRPGGVLFLELSSFPWILKHYRDPPEVTMEIDGVTVTRTARHEFDFHRGVMEHHDHFTWVDESGAERTADKVHRMAMVSYPEIAWFLEDLGFEDIHTFNSLSDRSPAPLTGRKVIVSARRGTMGNTAHL